MDLIDSITTWWGKAKADRFGLIADDPNPPAHQLSNLDRWDGLK